MKRSESIQAVVKALIVAQGNMGDVRKTATNPAFRSKYADLAAVVEAVLPALQAAGIAVIQNPSCIFDESGAIVTVETIFAHESGEWLGAELAIRPTKSDPQAIGSAITYGRRYSLLSLAGVAPEDDDGNSASVQSEAPTTRLRPKNNGPFTAAAAPASRASEHNWTNALTALASKLPAAEVQRACQDHGVAGIGDVNTRELARTIYAVLHSLADTHGVAV